ncbi:MAG TPA: thioredoxin domain-containing protein [Burkholderiales bacterium]|nr:thioredoxin domain-containing protein [Burkholderiales bacterium]
MPNRLAKETSPYLQQHAGNPVDWYAWGEEALQAAHAQDKPILLSIGYSACHWCHVMAQESFEDPEVAALMNRHFINIKVDREERPDLDQIYQLAHQMMSQRSGGWPLTMFLTPGEEPFFGGTYFPKTPRYGLPGFAEMLERVAQFYRAERAQVARQGEAIVSSFERLQPAQPAHQSDFSGEPLELALKNLAASYDAHFGGFGAAPKFPHPTDLELCLRRHAASAAAEGAGSGRPEEGDPLTMAVYTLGRMAVGGIYDQLGGGFCRYSVDAYWLIPHFEKMLYDNGPLLARYSDAWALTRDPLFAEVVEETVAWALREMQSPQGGYYSSLDADSEHEEGKFYVWTPQQARALLSEEEYAVCAPFYGLDGAANFEGTQWHLHVARGLEEIAETLGQSAQQCGVLLARARAKLFAARERRIRPGRDEKILTSWNALMIAGMARAARVFGRPEWLASARAALDFIRSTLWRAEQGPERARLLATYKDGRAHVNAYLDDYAFLLAALIELMQTDFHSGDLAFAEDLADLLLEQFYDPALGGFFFTSHDHEKLIYRPKPGYDSATPSGNGVAALALQRLGHITGESRYLDAAERTLQLFYPALAQHPNGYTSLLLALEEAMEPPRVVVLRGAPEQMRQWRRSLDSAYLPTTVILALAPGTADLPPLLAKPVESEAVNAWVCQGLTCLPPMDKLETLLEVLKLTETGQGATL